MKLTVGLFFDGTSNNIHDRPEQTITNVAKLYRVYGEADDPGVAKFYVRGVGSKKYPEDKDRLAADILFAQPLDEALGGAFGSGGHARIKRMVKKVEKLLDDRPEVTELTIDVFGFSRGAALARAFVNVIRAAPFAKPHSIRFLGIFDTVGSFGIPGDNKDPFDFRVKGGEVRYVYHVVAENELRKNFDLRSIRGSSAVALDHDDSACTGDRWMVEILCPGVHSDIGGSYDVLPAGEKKLEHGNNNNQLSRVYLDWMYSVAKGCGVPFVVVPKEEREEFWECEGGVKAQLRNLLDYYERVPGRRLRHAILRETEEYLKQMEDKRTRTPKKKGPVGKKKPNPAFKRIERHIKEVKGTIVPLVGKLFLEEAFSNRESQCADFLKDYAAFCEAYMHTSHAPTNKTIGMGVQFTSAVVNSKVWDSLLRTAYESVMKDALKRDVFWNV